MIKIGTMYFPDGERHFQVFAEDIEGYQRPQRDYAFNYVTNWDLALDLGANVGIFARHFAEKFKEVWAIEPLSVNIECLKMNVPDNVKLKQIAVGDRSGSFKMYQDMKSTGGSFICDRDDVDRPPVNLDPTKIIDVEMVTVDSFDLSSVGLIKLDIQGSEVIALKGAAETIKRCRPVVLIEEKPIGGPTGATDHIKAAADLLFSFGMSAKDRVGADRIYVFE